MEPSQIQALIAKQMAISMAISAENERLFRSSWREEAIALTIFITSVAFLVWILPK